MFRFTVTLKQQFLLLGYTIFLNGILIGIYLYFFGFTFPYHAFIYSFSFLFLTSLFPSLSVHVQYLIMNWGSVLTIDKRNRTICYKSRKINIDKDFSDIGSVIYYGSFAGDSSFYTFGQYRYFKIVFMDKKEIVITALMMNDIKNKMEELLSIKLERHLRFVAFIY